VDVGLLILQGWNGEYDGWDPAAAWKPATGLLAKPEDPSFESV
jgi:hypothetical protein